MKVIICENVFVNDKVECCFTKDFLDKYPQYNTHEYFLGVGFTGIRNDQSFIRDLELFGIENAFSDLFTHRRMFIKDSCRGEYTVKPMGSYQEPIKIIELPDEITDWEIDYDYDEDGNPEFEKIIYVLNGKIYRIY